MAKFMTVRHPGRGGKGGRPYLPSFDAAPLLEARTVYTSSVETPGDRSNLLIYGQKIAFLRH